METIEIGAVELLSAATEPSREYHRFVRPVASPILSDFCTQLTTIRQQDVDAADTFNVVFPDFVGWIGADDFTFCSWGDYDARQLQRDCARHGIEYPTSFERHLNLKRAFTEWKGIKPRGMSEALTILNLPLVGQHHRGIDDAHNIASIARLLLPHLEP